MNYIKYPFLFFIAGDFLTTLLALEYGTNTQELNPFLHGLMLYHGYAGLLLFKALVLLLVVTLYYACRSDFYHSFSKWTLSILGFFLCLNNILCLWSVNYV